jgi:hypothetical protein
MQRLDVLATADWWNEAEWSDSVLRDTCFPSLEKEKERDQENPMV